MKGIVVAMAVAVLLCGCRSATEEHASDLALAPTVAGLELATATVEEVRDAVRGFGIVAADADPAAVRDARAQLAEADARRRLADEQVRRLRALGSGAVAPRKELEAALAEQAAAAAGATRAREALAQFGGTTGSEPLHAGERWVLAELAQPDALRVEVGAPARFVADALPGRTLDGRVDAAARYVDPASRRAPVRLRIDDPEHALRPGMTGAAGIAAGAARRALVVPTAAVVYDGALAVVFVEETAGRYAPHPVQLGIVADGRAEIRDGLADGARVVTTGAASLLSATRLSGAGD